MFAVKGAVCWARRLSSPRVPASEREWTSQWQSARAASMNVTTDRPQEKERCDVFVCERERGRERGEERTMKSHAVRFSEADMLRWSPINCSEVEMKSFLSLHPECCCCCCHFIDANHHWQETRPSYFPCGDFRN